MAVTSLSDSLVASDLGKVVILNCDQELDDGLKFKDPSARRQVFAWLFLEIVDLPNLKR